MYGIIHEYEGEIAESQPDARSARAVHVMERSNPSTSDIDSISRMHCTQNTVHVGSNTVLYWLCTMYYVIILVSDCDMTFRHTQSHSADLRWESTCSYMRSDWIIPLLRSCDVRDVPRSNAYALFSGLLATCML